MLMKVLWEVQRYSQTSTTNTKKYIFHDAGLKVPYYISVLDEALVGLVFFCRDIMPSAITFLRVVGAAKCIILRKLDHDRYVCKSISYLSHTVTDNLSVEKKNQSLYCQLFSFLPTQLQIGKFVIKTQRDIAIDVVCRLFLAM